MEQFVTNSLSHQLNTDTLIVIGPRKRTPFQVAIIPHAREQILLIILWWLHVVTDFLAGSGLPFSRIICLGLPRKRCGSYGGLARSADCGTITYLFGNEEASSIGASDLELCECSGTVGWRIRYSIRYVVWCDRDGWKSMTAVYANQQLRYGNRTFLGFDNRMAERIPYCFAPGNWSMCHVWLHVNHKSGSDID